MKLIITSIALAISPTFFSQTWTKISGIMDSTQIKGIAQIDNKILIAGQNWSNNTVTDYAFSNDGNTWTSLPTYNFAGYLPNSLPHNDLLLCSNGFTSTQKLNGENWQLFSGANYFAEFENGEIIGSMGSFPDTIYHYSNTGVKGAKLGDYKFKFSSKYCAGANNRVFVFAYGVGLGYLDYSDLSILHIPATLDGALMTEAAWDMKFITNIVKASEGTLFAIGDGLMKSTDNGENWTSSFFLTGTPITSIAINSLDEIFVISGANVEKSTDMGLSFNDISGNLPTSAQSAFKTQVFTNANNELFVTLNRNGGVFGGANSGIYKLTNALFLDDIDNFNFTLFPNPASKKTAISVPNLYTNSRIVITTSNGSIIYSNDMLDNLNQLDIENYAKGVYFISLISEFQTNTQKLVIE